MEAADQAVFYAIYQSGIPYWISELITHLMTGAALWVAAGVGHVVHGPSSRNTGWAILFGLLFVLVAVDKGLKHLVGRPRPFVTLDLEAHDTLIASTSYSFPSGHATVAFVGAFVLAWRYPRLRWALFGFASLVALSRVHLGVHYPSDVLAGSALGCLIGYGAVRAFKVEPA